MNYVHIISFDGFVIALPAKYAYLRDGLKWYAKDYLQLPGTFVIK